MVRFIFKLFLLLLLSLATFFVTNAQSSSGLDVDLNVNTPPPGGGGSGSIPTPRPENRIFNLTIESSRNSAVVSWSSTFPALSKLSWGESPEYEMGELSEINFSITHRAKIENLKPNTIYYLRIDAVGNDSQPLTSVATSFSTGVGEYPSVLNVSSLKATSKENGIFLEWRNPGVFDSIRIVRKDSGFPLDPQDGTIVFEGDATSYLDKNVIEGKTYFYGVFVRQGGNYSSGALVSMQYSKDDFGVYVPPESYEGNIGVYGKLQLEDFNFIQNNTDISFVGDDIIVTNDKKVTVELDLSILTELMRENTRNMMIEVATESRFLPHFNYMSRTVVGKNVMEITLPPFVRNGIYGFNITIYGNKGQIIDKIPGSFIVINSLVDEVPVPGEEMSGLGILWSFFWLILLLILLLIILMMLRRDREDRY